MRLFLLLISFCSLIGMDNHVIIDIDQSQEVSPLSIDIEPQEKCGICYENLTLEEAANSMSGIYLKGPCIQQHGKEFHKNCLLDWLKKKPKTTPDCPLCSENLSVVGENCTLCAKKLLFFESALAEKEKYQFRGKCIEDHGPCCHATCLQNYIIKEEKGYNEAFCHLCQKSSSPKTTKISQGTYSALPAMKRIANQHVFPLLEGLVMPCVLTSMGQYNETANTIASVLNISDDIYLVYRAYKSYAQPSDYSFSSLFFAKFFAIECACPLIRSTINNTSFMRELAGI